VARDVRPLGRSVALIVAALAGLLLTATRLPAQTPVAYDALVDQYARGDAPAALTQLARWTPAAVTHASSERPRSMSADQRRAAVMLHSDLAYAFLLTRATADASLQIGAARRVLAIMKNGGRGDERTQIFERHWFAFVASMYTAQGRLDQAEWIVRDGLSVYPRDAMLLVARGCIREMDATLTADDPRTTGQLSRVTRLREAAATEYRRALAYDDTLGSAHLHLGWVRFLAHDDRSAPEFEAALEHAADDTTRYLARLFLGAVAERQSRFEDARREYEAALALGPTYQTAFIALGRAEEALGHSTRAQELAQGYASLREKHEDPWWDYHLGGFDQPTLDWLRREARSQ
jgi:tetratricopeptide (TPR) repeat protein